ncbi:MAG: Ig-like domain-containing protein, partial [Armatimonadetes bacterium]|nr:Ig-like domain-containing protein [Armatimonadota bacterium]
AAAAPAVPLPADEPPPPLRAEFGIAHLLPGTVITSRIALSAYYPEDWEVRYVTFLVNGKPFHATNRAPFQATWDPSGLDPGRYELAIKVTRGAGEAVVSPPLGVEVRSPQ